MMPKRGKKGKAKRGEERPEEWKGQTVARPRPRGQTEKKPETGARGKSPKRGGKYRGRVLSTNIFLSSRKVIVAGKQIRWNRA